MMPSLHHCITASLHHCTTASLHHRTTAPPYRGSYVSIILFHSFSFHHISQSFNDYTISRFYQFTTSSLHHRSISSLFYSNTLSLHLRTPNCPFKTILHHNLKWRIKHKNGVWTYQMVHQHKKCSSKWHQTHLYLSPNVGYWSIESISCISLIFTII